MQHTAIVSAAEWKPQASTRNQTTEQRDMALLGLLAPMGLADVGFLRRCSWEGACRYAIQRCGKDDYQVADEMPISHGHMSKVLKGAAGLHGKRLVKFMRLTQCLAPLQWLAEEMGCDLVQRSSKEAEVAALRSRLAELQEMHR